MTRWKMNKRDKRQKKLDNLKEKVSSKKLIKWEDVKRKEGSNSLFDLEFLDKTSGTSLAKLEDSKAEIIPSEIKEALDKQLQPGKNINVYRELKTLLVEHPDLLKRAQLSDDEIDVYKNKVDDLIVETNTKRYEDALERLSDDAGFNELEKLEKEYKRSVETLALETVIKDKKQINSAKVNLLEMLRGEDNDK